MGHLDNYLSKLSDWIMATGAIELSINHDGSVWLERAGDVFMQCASESKLESAFVHDLATSIANKRDVTLNDSSPLLSATVEFGALTLRAQAVIPPATPNGTVLSFRIFGNADGKEPKRFDVLRSGGKTLTEQRALSLKDLMLSVPDVQSVDEVDAFLGKCISKRLNVVIAGGTSTGKTELGRRLLWMVPPEERILTIEDSAELLPRQPNVVSLIADRRDDSARSTQKLLQAALRLRPDRIIVGELRGSEVVTFLDAINTGHSGSFTTVHADSAAKALDRLAFMVMGTGSQLTYADTLGYLRNSIDVIIHTGRTDANRGVQEIYFPGLSQTDQAA